MGQWSELLPDLLILIERRLLLYVDQVRFRAVCVSWKSAPPKINVPFNQPKQFPWLLHPITKHNNNNNNNIIVDPSHGLFYPLGKKDCQLYLPEANGMFFYGSSHGWVVTMTDPRTRAGPDMFLLNPLTRAQIKLPPRSKFPDVVAYHPDKVGTESEYTIHLTDTGETFDTSADEAHLYMFGKVVLSSSPFEDDCVVVAIFGQFGKLAYCRCGDKEWTFLYGPKGMAFTDVIFHKGKLHALNTLGELLVFESISLNSKVTQISHQALYGHYLVECCDGGLILIHRSTDDDENQTFKLHKFDPNASIWFEVYNIGNDMLFLGWNSTLAISSLNFPGCKGNRIYFADDHDTLHYIPTEGVKIGVFDLEDGNTQSLSGYYIYDPKLVWPPPIWTTPSTFDIPAAFIRVWE